MRGLHFNCSHTFLGIIRIFIPWGSLFFQIRILFSSITLVLSLEVRQERSLKFGVTNRTVSLKPCREGVFYKQWFLVSHLSW
jgi:hypothetical protein